MRLGKVRHHLPCKQSIGFASRIITPTQSVVASLIVRLELAPVAGYAPHAPISYLPTTGAGVVRYLAEYADKLSINTLKQRLAALAHGILLRVSLTPPRPLTFAR